MTLAAAHQSGNICIEVRDDGAGLNRERILAKAKSQGMNVHDGMSNDEVAMLIMAQVFNRRGRNGCFGAWCWNGCG